jgi:hypothetical protein
MASQWWPHLSPHMRWYHLGLGDIMAWQEGHQVVNNTAALGSKATHTDGLSQIRMVSESTSKGMHVRMYTQTDALPLKRHVRRDVPPYEYA